MKLQSQTGAIISIIAGLLVIIFPDIIAWVIGLYLIISGILKVSR